MTLEAYLTELGSSEPIIQKSKSLEKLANEICPEPIEDFFVSEFSAKDSQHVIDAIWFFSKRYILEGKKILSDKYSLDVACIFGIIETLEISYSDYDPLCPETVNDKSKLVIYGRAGTMGIHLVATQKNCLKLWSIFTRFLKPNLVELIEDDT